jgi:predicted DNA-binding protein YlxM (UPF0122 family)
LGLPISLIGNGGKIFINFEKTVKMKTALQIEITFEQILELVRSLPKKKKIKLSKELERDVIDSKLTELLQIFKTDELSMQTVEEEVEKVRQDIYDEQKH